MALAAYRLWRIIGQDDWPPSRWLRKQLAIRDPATEGREPTGLRETFWAEIRTMIECPWCLGFWSSVVVVTITAQITNVPQPILQALACSCITGLIGTNLDDD